LAVGVTDDIAAKGFCQRAAGAVSFGQRPQNLTEASDDLLIGNPG
jgi:hypothetical protein